MDKICPKQPQWRDLATIRLYSSVFGAFSRRGQIYHKNVTSQIKDMGGLSYSTEDVYKICSATETVIRKLIKEGGGFTLSTKYYFSYITVNTLEYFIEKEVFTSLIQHSFDQPSTLNHRTHLIRAIINKYTTIRL